jgi:glutamate--cysteine ligase
VTVDVAPRRRSGLDDPALCRADQAAEYIAGICFKTGPPELVGIELEWTVHHLDDPGRPLDPALLARALRPYTPSTLDPEADPPPLPGGNILTVEPGGQVEISSLPHPSLAALVASVDADLRHLTGLLATAGLRLGEHATDPYRPPRRLLRTPRYDAMADTFAARGPDGETMMCSTAAVQVSLDAGEPDRVAARFAALHALGPVLIALFANSPYCAGQPTGWASSRMRSWLLMDQARSGPVPADADPAVGWARYALAAPVMCVRQPGGSWHCPQGITFADWIGGALDRPPTYDDLDYHLSTLFPPVRPRGYVEVRYLDQQPPGEWHVPAAVLAALFADEAAVDAAREDCAPVDGRWIDAARYGLADPAIAAAARKVAGMATAGLAGTGLPDAMCAQVTEVVDRRLAAGGERAG